MQSCFLCVCKEGRMSAKEDVLEQIVEEYCLHKGYFVRHNIKFRPREDRDDIDPKQDSNHSDIDILAFNPKEEGYNRVWAISCKSWQSGFYPEKEIFNIENNRIVSGRERWKFFRELVKEKWSEAFIEKIKEETGYDNFTYITAVTVIHGDKKAWEENINFKANIRNNKIKVIDLKEMLNFISPRLSTTLANTQIGRMLQLMKAAKLTS